MSNKYTAMDVANYIVNYANNTLKASNLTPIKLQKILYYVYVNCLVKQDTKLFNQSIEKWKFGPVVSDVYHNFKMFGTSHIDSTISTFEVDNLENGGFSVSEVPFDPEKIKLPENVLKIIHATIRELIDVDPFKLVEDTHKEEPWKRMEKDILKGVRGLVYTDEEIKKYLS